MEYKKESKTSKRNRKEEKGFFLKARDNQALLMPMVCD